MDAVNCIVYKNGLRPIFATLSLIVFDFGGSNFILTSESFLWTRAMDLKLLFLVQFPTPWDARYLHLFWKYYDTYKVR